jgi:neutral ceramidase
MKAGFAESEITPPLGTHKIGWLVDIVPERIRDPLYLRCAVVESKGERIGFIQLDLLSIRWSQARAIREQIWRRFGLPASHVMVSATHNHAGPAVAHVGCVNRDEGYLRGLEATAVETFGRALESLEEAELGFSRVFDFTIAHNRRVVMRDGTVRTHGSFSDPNSLFLEGPIDPEVAVIAARGRGFKWLGCLVNYACHPTHLGGEKIFSAGYPGVLAAEMKGHGFPVTLFLNGASGNLHTTDPATGRDTSMEEAGRLLADDAVQAVKKMRFRREATVGAAATTIELPCRAPTAEEVRGTAHGAQRFIDPAIYDDGMPRLVARIAERGAQPAEVQALFINDIAVVGIPAEYFVEHGLRIKEKTHPAHTLVVGGANGMVGYVPTKAAFERGGYETTFAPSSRLAPEAGDILADAAIALIRDRPGSAGVAPRP